MHVDISREYETLYDNSIVLNIWITNNSDFVINNVEVILDHNESLFKLQGDLVQQIESIPPTVARVVKFRLKPLGCIHREFIQANITYRDYKWEKHVLPMEPLDIHYIYPFLSARPMSIREFIDLSSVNHSVQAGLNFEGVYVDQILLFIIQTCADRMHKVGERSVEGGRIVYLSGESVGNGNYYLLTALIRKNDVLTQVMLKAVSSNTAATKDFLNEVASKLRQYVASARSAKEVGVIRDEQVTSIIDSAMKQSILSVDQVSSSIISQDGVLGSNKESPAIMVNIADSVLWHPDESEEDVWKKEEERQRRNQEEQERLRRREEERRILEAKRLKEWTAAEKAERNSPRTRKQTRFRSVAIVLAAFLVFLSINSAPILEMDQDNTYQAGALASSDAAVESTVVNFLRAVNEGDSGSAFALYKGEDFLSPASITMIFKNKGIQAGGIRDITVSSTEVSGNLALVKANCLISNPDLSGRQLSSYYVPIYFRLQNSGAGWVITRVSFTPLGMYDGQQIGKQSTQEVSSNLMIKNIEGVRAKSDSGTTSPTIDLLKLSVGLNVGSAPVDLNQVVISITEGTTAHNLVYAGNDGRYGRMNDFDSYSAANNLRSLLTGTGNPSRYYTVDRIRDEDGSFSQANPVMNTGDLMIVYLATTSSSTNSAGYTYMGSLNAGGTLVSSQLNLVPRTTVNIVMTPSSGAVTVAEFVTPSSYGVKETVQLYP